MKFSQAQGGILSLFLVLASAVDAAPQRKGKGGNQASGGGNRASGGASGGNQASGGVRGGATGNGLSVANAGVVGAAPIITQATDGSTIMDKTVMINGLPIHYKISAPANQFTTASTVPGGTQAPGAAGTGGMNVLLHGDGGQSFLDFPNQAVQDNLMGVVVQAPNDQRFWGGGAGLQRTDGVAHAQAVNDLIQNQLPQDVAFNKSNVYFTGVSGGSLMMSGFFMPAFGAQYQTGIVLNCGGLPPQVPVVDPNTLATTMKIHFQSTQDELTLLQPALPKAITAYEALATTAGLSAQQIGALQTVDNSPVGGGHCGFDGKGFVSGIQLVANGYSQIMGTNPSGNVPGIQNNVLKTVVGNENPPFVAGKTAQK